MERQFKRICIFCGSSSSTDQSINDAVVELGNEMIKRKIGLTYGGGTRGLMGLIAKTINDGGGEILGIIPEALIQRETHESIVYGEQIIVQSMHERKIKMYKESDAFIALPGGFGTLDELMEIITWAQLGIHTKPIGILNVSGYFDGLIEFFKTCTKKGLVKEEYMDLFIVDNDPSNLINRLQTYSPKESPFNWNVKV